MLFLILFWAFCPQLLLYRLFDWHFNSLNCLFENPINRTKFYRYKSPCPPLGHSCRCNSPSYLMTIVLRHFGRQRSADLTAMAAAICFKEHVTARARRQAGQLTHWLKNRCELPSHYLWEISVLPTDLDFTWNQFFEVSKIAVLLEMFPILREINFGIVKIAHFTYNQFWNLNSCPFHAKLILEFHKLSILQFCRILIFNFDDLYNF